MPETDAQLPLPRDKGGLRLAMKQRRAAANAENKGAPLALRALFLDSVRLPADAIIAGYMATDNEIDPLPLLKVLHERRHRLALPVIGAAGMPLSFRIWAPGAKLLAPRGLLPIPEPAVTAGEIEPDILLVPLLAFDRQHNRLGRGGGYYDRTLASLRARHAILAVGIAFACQEVETAPTEENDARLDKIVTEREVF